MKRFLAAAAAFAVILGLSRGRSGAAPLWPLPKRRTIKSGGKFGKRRPLLSGDPTTHHAGIDIGGKYGDAIVAPEDGTIIKNQGWDGPNAVATLLQTKDRVLLFGAVRPGSRFKPGTEVKRGQKIAEVGRYPGGSQMLHFETYRIGTTKNHRWYWGESQPDILLDPTDYVARMV